MATTPKLNILLSPTFSPKTIAIGDISFYPAGYVPVNPTIEITPPSLNKVTLAFSAKNFNIFNASDLNIICEEDVCILPDLPDGLWTFKYSISPSHTYYTEVKYMRVDSIILKWQKAFLKTDLSECDDNIKSQDLEMLDQINGYIIASVAAANECDFTSAINFYQIADKKLADYYKTKC